MSEMTPPPAWHRQFWPWFLIALPASVVIACAVTIWLALRSPNPMVVDDYYREGLAINQSLQQVQRAAAMQLSADLRYDRDLQRITLRLPGDRWVEPPVLRFIHPVSAQMDVSVDLESVEPGVYAGSVALASQRWYVRLSGTDGHDTWRLQGEFDPSISNSLTLQP